MKTGVRYYRYVSRDGKYETAWRRLWSSGLVPPGPRQRAKLGEGYAVVIRQVLHQSKTGSQGE